MPTRKTHIRLVLYFGVFALVVANRASAYTIMGNVKSYQQDGYNITFDCENGKVRLSFLADDLVRVHMAPAGADFPQDTLHLDENGPYAVVTYNWPGVKYTIKQQFDFDLEGFVYAIRAGKLIVKVRKEPFKLAFYESNGKLLVMEKEGIVNAGLGYEGSKVYETMALGDDEHFFGFGAHNHPLDMRGERIVCSATELQSKARTGGFPVPFFYSSRGYGIFFNNLDDDVTFEMGTTPGQYSFEATSGGMEGWDMDYYFIYGPKFEKIIKRYTSITGKPILPEKWFFGHIQHHCCDWTAEKIIEVAKKYRQGNWPCDVLIMDWQALGEDFSWAPEFQNYKKMYEVLDELGFKTAYSCALFHAKLYDWKSYDPTLKRCCDKYWSMHVPRVLDGIDFWRQDNSERSSNYTGLEKFANGYEAHNLFGSLWAKNVVEGMERLGLYGRPVISRGGPIGGHRYIIPWPGDLSHGLDFLKIDLNFIRNGSLAGYAAIAVDLGGFVDRGGKDPLEEQNIIRRTINIIPFIPISKFQGAGDRSAKLPWLLSPEQQDLMRQFLKLRYRLHPYIYSCAVEANLTGRPILAPLVFDYQDDPKTYSLGYEFMLGRQILVAPVLEKSERQDVYLPQGEWIHYWSGKKYTGGRTVTVDAPLYSRSGLPMFVKAGSIIPMMPEMNYIYEKKPEPVSLDVYPAEGQTSTYVLYDRKIPKQSPLKRTEFRCSDDKTKIEVAIGPSEVSYELWVHYDKEPASVAADSRQLPRLDDKSAYDSAEEGWYYGPGCFYGCKTIKTVNVKLAKSSQGRFIRIIK